MSAAATSAAAAAIVAIAEEERRQQEIEDGTYDPAPIGDWEVRAAAIFAIVMCLMLAYEIAMLVFDAPGLFELLRAI